MQIDKPGYFAIIPADVRYDERLRANAKLFYAEITALCNKRGYCTASNEYFAGLFGLSGKTVSQLIGQLVDCKYIRREVFRDERGAVLERRLWVKTVPQDALDDAGDPPPKNGDTSPDKSGDPPPKNVELLKENNTRANNTPTVPQGDAAQPEAAEYTPKDIVALYHTLCPALPQCRLMTDKRRRAVSRLRKAGVTRAQLTDAFRRVGRSSFCTGTNDRGWHADLEWLLNENNIVKVLEGKYDDKSAPSTAPQKGGYHPL